MNTVFKTVSSSQGSTGGGMLWEDPLRKHSDGERVLTNTQASWLQMVEGGLQQLLAPARTTHREVEPLSAYRDIRTSKYEDSAIAAASGASKHLGSLRTLNWNRTWAEIDDVSQDH